jgi:hypothetical protein
MVTWHLTIAPNDPAGMARFWAALVGYVPEPPPDGVDSWPAYYQSVVPEENLGGDPTTTSTGSSTQLVKGRRSGSSRCRRKDGQDPLPLPVRAHPGNGKAKKHRVHEPNPRTPASLSVASAMPSSKHRRGRANGVWRNLGRWPAAVCATRGSRGWPRVPLARRLLGRRQARGRRPRLTPTGQRESRCRIIAPARPRRR